MSTMFCQQDAPIKALKASNLFWNTLSMQTFGTEINTLAVQTFGTEINTLAMQIFTWFWNSQSHFWKKYTTAKTFWDMAASVL